MSKPQYIQSIDSTDSVYSSIDVDLQIGECFSSECLGGDLFTRTQTKNEQKGYKLLDDRL